MVVDSKTWAQLACAVGICADLAADTDVSNTGYAQQANCMYVHDVNV